VRHSSFKRLVSKLLLFTTSRVLSNAVVVAMPSSSRRLKRSLSTDVGLDSDQPASEGLIPAMSRKNRRKAAKKSKVGDQTGNDLADLTCHDLSLSSATTDVCNSKVQGDVQDVTVTVEPNCDHCCCVSENFIASLKLEVKELNEKVKTLTMQVETLTAALGLASNCTPTSTSTLTQSSSSQACANADTSNITSEPTRSYAAVIGNSSGVQQVHQQIHRNMVSAVYIDLEEKKKRANNVVICGLTDDQSFDDKAVITGMILQEFGRQITVKSTRRLGKKIDGKTQNVLAVLSSTDDVSYLVSNARLLRQSRNDFVRNNIYINADLTPAEAKASYELRCARRRRIPASQTGGRSSAAAVQSTETSAMPVTLQLSAAATPFAPSDTSGNESQRSNSTQSQVSESESGTRKARSNPVSAGGTTCVGSDGSNVSVSANVSDVSNVRISSSNVSDVGDVSNAHTSFRH